MKTNKRNNTEHMANRTRINKSIYANLIVNGRRPDNIIIVSVVYYFLASRLSNAGHIILAQAIEMCD